MAVPCDIPTAKAQAFSFSISPLPFIIYVCYGVLLVFNLLFLKITILVGTKEHPLVALSYISLTIMDGAHLFPHLLASCMFLEGCLARFSTSWVWDGHYTAQLPHFHSETLTF